MTLAFTICSINYLAQARTLGESLAVTNPGIRFVVGLVDRLEGIAFEANKQPPFELLEVETLAIPNWAWMRAKYDITELNTAVKPYFFTYFFSNYSDCSNFIYFDPDIIIFQPLTHLLDRLQQHPAVLTPHLTTPHTDTLSTNENDHLNTGTFNLGFIALRRSEEARSLLAWWCEKLAWEAFNDVCNGLFTDQKWMNLAPIYFQNTLIEKHLGYNVAYWNFHERHLSERNGQWLINETVPLIFFHFSGYGLARPDAVSKYQNRHSFQNRPDLIPLFKRYAGRLEANFNAYYSAFPCYYISPKKVIRLRRVRKMIRTPFVKLTNWLEGGD